MYYALCIHRVKLGYHTTQSIIHQLSYFIYHTYDITSVSESRSSF